MCVDLGSQLSLEGKANAFFSFHLIGEESSRKILKGVGFPGTFFGCELDEKEM